MPIYDHNGNVLSGVSKIYDDDGTTSSEIGKVYDSDGTVESLIYDDKGGLTVTNWSGSDVTAGYGETETFSPTSTVTITITAASIRGSAPYWANPHGNGYWTGNLYKYLDGVQTSLKVGESFTVNAGGSFKFAFGATIIGDPTNLFTRTSYNVSWEIS